MDTVIEFDLARILGAVKEVATQVLTVYIPNKDKNGALLSNYEKWVKEARDILTVIGGGATTMPPADGSWLDPALGVTEATQLKDSYVILEKTTLITTYIQAQSLKKNLGALREFLHRFGRETNQGEVALEYDGRFYKIREYDAR